MIFDGTNGITFPAGGQANPSGNILDGNITGTLTTAAQPNVTSVGILSALSVTGNVNAGNITGTLTTAAQPNVTSVGILSALSVTGNITGNTSLIGNSIRSLTAVDQPYQMVVRTSGYTVPDGTSDIVYDVLVHSRYMSHNSGNNMIFQQPGKYLITTGWRFGSGGDVWTGVRLLDTNGTVRGLGYGTGQVLNDPGPCSITFIADIPADRVNQNMRMQFMRAGSSMVIATPAAGFGYAIVTTVIQVGV
jgi:hypothetical protein